MNFLKKLTILQFFIILFLIKINLSNDINYNVSDTTIDNNDALNLKNISSFRYYIDNNESINELINDNNYFYFFKNKNMLVYFIHNSVTDEHFMYFNGIQNIGEFIDFFIYKIKNSTHDFINDILDENGSFYQINYNDGDSRGDVNNLELRINCLYINSDLKKILFYMIDKYSSKKLKIYGYSLGGIFSQYFMEKYKYIYDNSEIELKIINIESWFDGNESKYNKFIAKYGSIKNIFNKQSLLYIHNKIYQNFNKTSNLFEIDFNNIDEEYIINNYFLDFFPFGFIKFWLDQHNLNYNISNSRM